MDVDKISFYPLLIDIISDISKAHFVAFDLELSGIPSKGSSNDGRSSIQERYLETKAAAEKYQILQIGITCVEQDIVNDKYILKPYNFDLCPLIPERLGVDRIFSFQSGAGEFLMSVGFDMNRPFAIGVPYTSRDEAKLARDKYAKRQERGNIADIQIKDTEVESLAFVERVRKDITAWNESRRMDKPEYLIILPRGTDALQEGEAAPELSRFEKRLVHQVVRAEFQDLVSINRRGVMQIVRFNKERENKLAADRKRQFEEQLARQKGFRWVIEALLGNNISGLDLQECAKDAVTGEPVFVDMDDYKARFHRAQALLRGNPRVMVGHNCFLDLVYIYRQFIGDLPDTVEEFQQILHSLWPVIVDTKYMSTHNCGDINPVSSLEQIAEQLKELKTPIVETDKDHQKYNNMVAFHEAGYDSFLTAQVAVRLSAKLEREGAYIEFDRRQSEVPEITNGVKDIKLTGAALNALNTSQSAAEVKDGEQPATNGAANGFTPSVVGAKWKRRGDETIGPAAPDDPFYKDPRDLKHRHIPADVTIPDGMPRFRSDFWRVYGNKLRQFGTKESVCVLDGSGSEISSDDGGVEV